MEPYLQTIETDSGFTWPKRGRKPEPIPEHIANALHTSFSNGSTASVVIPEAKVVSFRNLLSKAGKQLNYRIEHDITDSTDKPGYKVYRFRTRTRRQDPNNE